MAVNLVAPDPALLYPVRGVEIGVADGRRAQGQPPRSDGGPAGRRQQRGGRVHRQPLLRRAGAAVPRTPGGRHRAFARSWSTPATPTPAPAPTAWRARAPPARRWRAAGHRARAGAAVFHRRDHGDRCRSSASRPRCRRRWPMPAPDHWAPGGGSHHDHRHAAQGGVAPAADRRQDGDHHRHLQGRRHDPAEHGDHARLRRHRCGDRAGADAARW